MHHSPSLPGRGAGTAPAHLRAVRPSGGRATVLLALALAAGAPGAAAAQAPAQTPAPPAGAPAAERLGTPALESALAAEPIPPPRTDEGTGPWTYGLVLGGVALVLAGAGVAMYLRRDREPLPEEPFLVFAPPAAPPPERPLRISAPQRAAAPVPTSAAAAPAAVRAAAPERIPVPRMAPAGPPRPAAEPDDELTVRLEVPAEGRLQFLPGALEVVDGADRQREIRFLRSAGAVTEYTLGRAGGPPTSHVQLQAPTVSRQHARMRFADGAWTISNLSSTNPLRVNGHELAMAEESRALADGDRIEVGEVVLRFRGPAR
ncbi:MAG TPA: FHA domain-containing protein [Longimicrobiaceae bacterium]